MKVRQNKVADVKPVVDAGRVLILRKEKIKKPIKKTGPKNHVAVAVAEETIRQLTMARSPKQSLKQSPK